MFSYKLILSLAFLLFLDTNIAFSQTPSPTSSTCGDAILDDNEECDLGTDLNNDTEENSFGCKKNCTKHANWTCTKTMADYKAKQLEADALYTLLASKQTDYVTNQCKFYYSNINETDCYIYQQNLSKFKEYNKVLKVNCSPNNPANTNLLERPANSAQTTTTSYKVNCIQ